MLVMKGNIETLSADAASLRSQVDHTTRELSVVEKQRDEWLTEFQTARDGMSVCIGLRQLDRGDFACNIRMGLELQRDILWCGLLVCGVVLVMSALSDAQQELKKHTSQIQTLSGEREIYLSGSCCCGRCFIHAFACFSTSNLQSTHVRLDQTWRRTS